MPSIRELFADPNLQEEGSEVDLDIDKILNSVTDVLNDRAATPGATIERTDEEDTPPPEDSSEEVQDEVGVEEGEDEEVPPPASSPPHDPWQDIPADRRAAILALDQTLMSDEGKRAAVFGILSGQAEPAQEVERLPEDVDPDSFEAKLWRENQEIKQQLSAMSKPTRELQEAFAKQQANAQAMEAGNNFAKKYEGKLSQQDILDIAKYAGQTGLAAAMRNTTEGRRNPVGAFEQALESTLWSNESFRARVMGAEPEKPVGEQPEAVDRKRKLKAVSSSASPVSGPSPKRPPAETGADGRLTEKSRQSLVKELANGIARQSEGTY